VSQREKILGVVVLALVALWGGKAMLDRYSSAVNLRRTQVQNARTRLAEADRALAKGRAALRQIEGWQERSLPDDREKALSLYKAWLLAKAKESGLVVEHITPSPRTSSSAAFQAIGYQIEAGGPLSAVATMLYEFYRSPQLQQITRLRLSRPIGASQVEVTMDVEALSLPGAVATDSLPEGESERLQLASAAEYQKSLTERDLVSVFRPPRPPRDATARRDPPAPPKFDDAELARLSAVVGSGKGWQAWIYVRTTGETLRVAAGDALKVGTLEGQIVSVERRSMVFESGEKKFRVALGETLRGGKEIEGESAVPSDSTGGPPKG
jgi:hypothetical protein